VCEDSASAEISVTEIASAMAEITYLIDEMKSQFEKNDTPFEYGNNFGDDDAALGTGAPDDNMPANLEELKDLMRLYFFSLNLFKLNCDTIKNFRRNLSLKMIIKSDCIKIAKNIYLS
jgi:hypothetical protein